MKQKNKIKKNHFQDNLIYDIKGIGKKIWQGVDAQEYVNNERSSWE